MVNILERMSKLREEIIGKRIMGRTMKIDRDDVLELTRRMTPSRTCFDRIAVAYMDEWGEVDESFNIHFIWQNKLIGI